MNKIFFREPELSELNFEAGMGDLGKAPGMIKEYHKGSAEWPDFKPMVTF